MGRCGPSKGTPPFSDGVTGRVVDITRRAGLDQLLYVGRRIPAVIDQRVISVVDIPSRKYDQL
jgi:hypothetical protein